MMPQTGMCEPTVLRWQERYLDDGVPSLKHDKSRPLRALPLPRDVRLMMIAKTVHGVPSNAAHESRTMMAAAVGVLLLSVRRIRTDAGRKPLIMMGFKVSNVPIFETKVT